MRTKSLVLVTLFVVSIVLLGGSGSSTTFLGKHSINVSPSQGSSFDYLIVIIMENKNYGDIIGSSSAPSINNLANTYGLATNYHNLASPSLPNYLGLTGGSTFGCEGYDGNPNSNSCTSAAWNSQNIMDRLESAGLTWRAYMENMPSNCYGSDSGNYYVRHDPFVYYNDVVNTQSRCNQVVPAGSASCVGGVTSTAQAQTCDSALLNDLSSTSTASNYMWLTPNACNDMHNCGVSTGDTYFSYLIPLILNSQVFKTQRAALVLTWDENSHIPAIWAGPTAKTSFTSGTNYDHYSLLKTVETNWNLPTLTSNDLSASPMTEFFTGTGTAPGSLQASFTYTPSNPAPNQTVTITANPTGGTPPYNCTWNLGDGTMARGTMVTHAYKSAQTYTVSLTVNDSSSHTAQYSHGLTVSTPAGLPISLILISIAVVAAGLVTVFLVRYHYHNKRLALRAQNNLQR